MLRAMTRTHSRPVLCLKKSMLQMEVYDTDINSVKSSLVTYTSNVRSHNTNARSSLRDTCHTSVEEISISSRIEPITIDSDREVSPSEYSEDDIWADADEYQNAVLAAPRLTPPDSVTKLSENRALTAKEQWAKAGEGLKSAEELVVTARQDHYARVERQYRDVQLEPYRKALKKDDYFYMPNYPTSTGRPPVVIYVTNENQLNGVIGLLKGHILSLDLEWVIRRTMNISLIQISDAHTVLLIQIFRFSRFPPKLRELIENPDIIKCGVAIMGADMSKLRDLYNVWAKGVCELSAFARLIDRAEHGPQNRLISLSNLAKFYLGAPLQKGPVRSSNWNRIPLSPEQREYAAIDAYAGYLIFIELERRRQERAEFANIWPVVDCCPERAAKVLQPVSRSEQNQKVDGSTADAEEEAACFVKKPQHGPYNRAKSRMYVTDQRSGVRTF